MLKKSCLLALMGIETNFGTYVAKWISCHHLQHLVLTKEDLNFLQRTYYNTSTCRVKKIDHKILYGSWAGAFGYFQFMPSTIEQYAIDYDKDNIIELKSTKDAFASAANYINKIGWKKNEPCFIKS